MVETVAEMRRRVLKGAEQRALPVLRRTGVFADGVNIPNGAVTTTQPTAAQGAVRQQQVATGGAPAQLPDIGATLRPSTGGQAFANTPVNPFASPLAGTLAAAPSAPQPASAVDTQSSLITGLLRQLSEAQRSQSNADRIAAGAGSAFGGLGREALANQQSAAKNVDDLRALLGPLLQEQGGLARAELANQGNAQARALDLQGVLAQVAQADRAAQLNANALAGQSAASIQEAALRGQAARDTTAAEQAGLDRRLQLTLGAEQEAAQGKLAAEQNKILAQQTGAEQERILNAVKAAKELLPDSLLGDSIIKDPALLDQLQRQRIALIRRILAGEF